MYTACSVLISPGTHVQKIQETHMEDLLSRYMVYHPSWGFIKNSSLWNVSNLSIRGFFVVLETRVVCLGRLIWKNHFQNERQVLLAFKCPLFSCFLAPTAHNGAKGGLHISLFNRNRLDVSCPWGPVPHPWISKVWCPQIFSGMWKNIEHGFGVDFNFRVVSSLNLL